MSHRALSIAIVAALAGCGAGQDEGAPADGGTPDHVRVAPPRHPDASADHVPSGDGARGARDGGGPSPDAGCGAREVTLASLTAHNTSASPHYDQGHFAANFGAKSWVAQSGTTMTVDPSKMDLSMNPVTPGHVSATDVHTLVPSRPDVRWFAHVTPWFRKGGPHIDIGLDNDSTAYVAAMVTDMKRRGFDGLIVDWYGEGSFEDSVTLLIQKYLATLPAKSFTFIVMMDKGIAGLSESVLETQIAYCQSQYFTDANYELEGKDPILMFFGVDSALGGSTMSAVKAKTGSNMVWVTEGSSSLSSSWVDQSFDWTHDYHDGDVASDPYNLAGVSGYLSSVAGSTKKAFGSMSAGFNGTLTKSVAWSEGKYLPRGSGACLVEWAGKIDAVIPKNVTRMQWATWSDWEEGTEIESGVENDVVVSASVHGSTLSWTIAGGTGDESTIDHYEIYASADGVNALDLGPVPVGTKSFQLGASECLLTGTSYRLEVVAVGRPCVRDHASGTVRYAP